MNYMDLLTTLSYVCIGLSFSLFLLWLVRFRSNSRILVVAFLLLAIYVVYQLSSYTPCVNSSQIPFTF